MEIWRKIKGYSMYEVSSLGRIRKVSNLNSKLKPLKLPYIVNQFKNIKGYLRCNLVGDGKIKQNQLFVHRLIAIAFIENKNNLPQVNHINGLKEDNSIENLEWCTALENLNHAFINGLRKPAKGSNHFSTILTESKVIAIKRLHRIKPNFNRSQLAIKIGVSKATIFHIIKGETWGHISI